MLLSECKLLWWILMCLLVRNNPFTSWVDFNVPSTILSFPNLWNYNKALDIFRIYIHMNIKLYNYAIHIHKAWACMHTHETTHQEHYFKKPQNKFKLFVVVIEVHSKKSKRVNENLMSLNLWTFVFVLDFMLYFI